MAFESSPLNNPDNYEGLEPELEKDKKPEKTGLKRMLQSAALLASLASGYAASELKTNAHSDSPNTDTEEVLPNFVRFENQLSIPSAENVEITEEVYEETLTDLIGIAESTMKLEAYRNSEAYAAVEKYYEEIKELENGNKYLDHLSKDEINYVGADGTRARAIEIALENGVYMTSDSKLEIRTVLGIPMEITVDEVPIEIPHYSYHYFEKDLLMKVGISVAEGEATYDKDKE